jgi:hypothetical protein
LTKLRFANETAAQSAISNHRESSPAAFLAPPGPASYVCPMAISAPHSGGDGAAVADGAVSEERFRRVMASFATGVTVITTRVRGEVRGMTANAFMSGSLDPPLCVISVGVKARMHGFLMEAGHFGVNILGRGHAGIRTRQRDHRRQGGRAIRVRRSFAFRRPHLCVAADRKCFPDCPARRPARVAAPLARANKLADVGFLVSGDLRRRIK